MEVKRWNIKAQIWDIEAGQVVFFPPEKIPPQKNGEILTLPNNTGKILERNMSTEI